MNDAVVLGFETNGLGVARALAEAGIPVIGVADPVWHASWYTRCAHRIVRCQAWSAECVVETLLTLGKELSAPAPLLITMDEPVVWVSKHRDELSQYFKIGLPDEDTVQLLMSKVYFETYARQQQWPLPANWRVDTRAELDACAGSLPYPCIMKPAVKNSAFRLNSPKKAFKIPNRKALFETYNMIRQWEPEVVIQEWIPGGDDRVTFCLGYWNTKGKPAALFAGRKLRQWPPECGNTAIAEPAPSVWADSVLCMGATIMRTVGYRGIGSVEFKMRPDGSPVIMEPTVGRTNYQNEVAVLNGVNIPAAAYYDLLGRSEEAERFSSPKRDSAPVKLIDSHSDTRAARFYMQSHMLTWSDWRQSRSGRRKYMLFRADDPLPFAMAVMRNSASYAKRTVRKVVRL